MKTNPTTTLGLTAVACALALFPSRAYGLGGNYPNGQPVGERSWPKGLSDLVNTTNRVGGLFVNEKDWFFFAGTKTNFNAFLTDFAKIQGIEHRLVLQDGAGEAFDLGGGNRRPCDWMLTASPKTWTDTNYVLEVHFWTGGKIAFDRAAVPTNIEVKVQAPPDSGVK